MRSNCKLCGDVNVALADSHILPRSFYPNEPLLLVSKEDYARKSPIGEYDQIVCRPCEKRFDLWDDHAFKILKENIGDKDVIPNPYRLILGNYDYSKLKMFFLSILWRLDASIRELGSNVNLGIEHRKKLTNMILSSYPGGWDEYQFIFNVYISQAKIILKAFYLPKEERTNSA